MNEASMAWLDPQILDLPKNLNKLERLYKEFFQLSLLFTKKAYANFSGASVAWLNPQILD